MMEQPATPSPAEPTSTERNWSVLTHLGTAATVPLGGWLINILIPLVVLLTLGGGSSFIASHAREELNFQISWTLYVLIAIVLAFLTLGLGLLIIIPVAIVVAIVMLVAIIQASIAASRGKHYRYPLTIRFVR